MSDMQEGQNIYKKWEFKQFMEYIKDKNIGRALMYAKALGIDRRTMQKWLTQPELAIPLTEALDKTLDDMKRAGKDDWRMHRELIKMLGLDDGETIKLADPDGNELKTALVKFVDEEKK